MQPLARTAPPGRSSQPRKHLTRCSWLAGLLTAIACSNTTQPDQPVHIDLLQGRWEGTSRTGVGYVYLFQATGRDSTNLRTGNVAPTYSLAYTLTPGGSGSVTAWYEVPKVYWGGSSLGTITDDTTMTVEAQNLAPFSLRKRPAGSSSPASALMIDAFRWRGVNGASDEYVQIYNNSTLAHTVFASSGTGYAIAASDGIVRCSIPNGTVIPARGHFLCVNSLGYSLASYPGGNGTTAAGDATYTVDIPDNAGIALFNNNDGGASFSLANRLDAVGATSEANTLYKEGPGLPALSPFSVNYAWVRDICGKGGSVSMLGTCPSSTGLPIDTGNNFADFYFVDTNGTSAGGGQRLGAPGPQALGTPVFGPLPIDAAALDDCSTDTAPPNRVRDLTSNPANNAMFGTLDIRRTFINNTGAPITRLRFRIIDLSTFPAPSGVADLRPMTSSAMAVTVDRAPCGTGTSNVTVNGTTLEQPPSQPNGGGFNSTLSVDAVTLGTPLADGASIDVRFLFGIQQTGNAKLGLIVESLPNGGAIVQITDATQ